jgi:predicted nucleotidyltransferase
MTELTPDFVDLLTALLNADVEFVVVGGYAVSFYGHARATKDIDVLVRANPANAKKLYKALAEFGAPLHAFEVAEEDFSDYEGILQLGIPPQRIDIINRITGVTYEEAIKDAGVFDLEGLAIKIIGLDALIKNKLAAGRDQDLMDAKSLMKVKR